MHPPRALLTVAAAAVLGAGGGAAVVAIAGDGSHAPITTIEAPRAPIADPGSTGSTGALDAAQVYAQAKGSVAYISSRTSQGEGTGSGFVVSQEGLLVTNAHVVEGATAVTVKVGDGETHPATVVGLDASTDLALLRVDDRSGEAFTPLHFADSSRLEVGDTTYAIGNPFGLDHTFTSGVVSALDRQIDAPNGYAIDHAIQTDAPINPGNSGGPLLDDHGRVIGVNSQILNGDGSSQSGNVGIGFAISSNTVRAIVAQLEATGHVEHAYLGVQLAPTETGAGAQVGGLAAGGPAADAGIHPGDTITALDGTPVQDAGALAAAIGGHHPGDEVQLTVERSGARETVTVTLGTQPQQPVN